MEALGGGRHNDNTVTLLDSACTETILRYDKAEKTQFNLSIPCEFNIWADEWTHVLILEAITNIIPAMRTAVLKELPDPVRV